MLHSIFFGLIISRLIDIPPGATPDEIQKIQNQNYQKKWRFKQTHMKLANKIEE